MDRCSDVSVSPDDVFLTGLHLAFIVFSFAFALAMEWYWGLAMIVVHAGHERLIGDCVLSRIQKRRGFSGPEDDFFFHLFCRLGMPQPRTVTRNIHIVIKTVILVIVVTKAVRWFL